MASISVGDIINNFEIISESSRDSDGHARYKVKCLLCGAFVDNIRLYTIKTRKGCFHFRRKWINKRIRIIFCSMNDRCYNVNNKSFATYGGKGIKICDEWLADPTLFEEWALSNGYRDDLTIDRIDNNQGYSPSNCRWVTRSENSRWKGNTRSIVVNGEKHSPKEWSKILNLSINYIGKYLHDHSCKETVSFIHDMLNGKVRVKSKNSAILDVDGEKLTTTEWSSRLGKSRSFVSNYRSKYGDEETILFIRNLLSGKKIVPRNYNILTVNGISDNGVGWSRRLGLKPSYINNQIRYYGIKHTEEKIKKLLLEKEIS